MENSYYEKKNIICSQCNWKFIEMVWLIIDIQEHQELVESIQNGSMHKTTCPNCRKVIYLDFPLLLFMSHSKPTLIFSPATGTDKDQDHEQYDSLVNKLREKLKGNWNDEWLDDLETIPILLLPICLTKGINSIPEAPAERTQLLVKLLLENPDLNQELIELSDKQIVNKIKLLDETFFKFAIFKKWSQSWIFLDEHPELLSYESQILLSKWIPLQIEHLDDVVKNAFMDVLNFIIRCREIGTASAYEEKIIGDVGDIPPHIKIQYLIRLCAETLEKVEVGGSADLVIEAMTFGRLAINNPNFLKLDERYKLAVFYLLGVCYSRHSQSSMKLSDINTALSYFQNAKKLTNDGSKERIMIQSEENRGLTLRYEITRNIADLNKSIVGFTNLSENHSNVEIENKLAYLTNFGNSLLAKYKSTGQKEVLDSAIEIFERLKISFPVEYSRDPRLLDNHSNCLFYRYEANRMVEDLIESISLTRKAITLLKGNENDYETYINNLATGLIELYDCDHNGNHLEEAKSILYPIVNKHEKTNRDPILLNTIGSVLRKDFYRNEDLRTLDEAIRYFEVAVSLTEKTSVEYPKRLVNLSTGLLDRYSCLGRMEDIEKANQLCNQAIKIFDFESPDITEYLAYYLDILVTYFEISNDTDLIGAGIEIVEDKLSLYSETDFKSPRIYFNLGKASLALFAVENSFDLIHKAIQFFRQAVNLTSKGSSGLILRETELARALYLGFLKTKKIEYWEEAKLILDRAIITTDQRSIEYPKILFLLGNLYHACDSFELATINTQQDASSFFMKSCQIYKDRQLWEPLSRISEIWAHRAFSKKHWSEASEAYKFYLEAIMHLYEVQITLDHKEKRLILDSTACINAAYCYAKLGENESAIEVMENYRTRYFSSLLARDNAELEELEQRFPELASQYKELSNKLWSLERQPFQTIFEIDLINPQLQEVTNHFNELVNQIKKNKGFETFLSPLRFDDIRSLTCHIPIVYFSITEHGSVAWLCRGNDPIITIWLDKLNSEELSMRVEGVREVGYEGFIGSYKKWVDSPKSKEAFDKWTYALDKICSWLWNVVMQPLLKVLKSNNISEVVLIPQGLLNLLPMTAAWTLDSSYPSGRKYAIDEAIFSYAPNARVLISAMKSRELPVNTILAIDNPDASLNFASSEISSALGFFNLENRIYLKGTEARISNFIRWLPNSNLLHFASHGKADIISPLNSSLQLAENEQLQIRDVISMSIKQARLVIMSACETAIPGVALPDEVLSFPCAWSQIGVPGVIGSLWIVNDPSTMLLISRFYEFWKGDSYTPVKAFHEAQIWLRDTSVQEKQSYFLGLLHEAKRTDEEYHFEYINAALRYLSLLDADDSSMMNIHYWASFGYYGW